MDTQKLSMLATIQCGLVLSRKEAKAPHANSKHYKRLGLKSMGEDGRLKLDVLDDFYSSDHLEDTNLTHANDILVRQFVPLMPVLIDGNEKSSNLVIPSQLAVIRIKSGAPVLSGYLRWYLSTPAFTDTVILSGETQFQRTIRIGDLSETMIPIPSVEKQQLIIGICETAVRREKLYQELIQEEKRYTNWQLQKLIGGTTK